MLNEELLRQAEEKNVPAMMKAAKAYFLGEDVERDEARAFALFNEIVIYDPSQADVYCDLGYCWFYGCGTHEDKAKGISCWEVAADLGSAKANRRLGVLYRDGKYFPQDSDKAVQYLEKAIELGDARANTELGEMYYSAIGVPKDEEKGVKLFEKAAEQGEADGQHRLAIAYRDGVGVPLDAEKALYWFKKAADQGGGVSMLLAGMLCQQQGDAEQAKSFYARAMEKGVKEGARFLGHNYDSEGDQAKAFECLKKGYELGDADSAYQLGDCYREGKGTDENLPLAIECYKYAAEQNQSQAALRLALCYHDGVGVEVNHEKEIEYYEKGANSEGEAKCYCARLLSDMYFNGNGVPRDFEKGIHYLTMAADFGHLNSIVALAEFYNLEENRDYNKALHCYLKAAEQENDLALIRLGIYAYDGLGMEKNVAQALDYFIKARERGGAEVEKYILYVLAREALEDCDIDVRNEFEHAKELAESGDHEAEYVVYCLMLHLPETTPDECYLWLYKALRGGYAPAIEQYARLWVGDLIEELDADMFIEGAQKTINDGGELSSQAYYVLGMSYMRTNGGNHNLVLAEKYIKQAADSGYVLAMRALGIRYKNGDLRYDREESIRYLKKAVDADDDQYASYFLAISYAEMNDWARAKEYMQRASLGQDQEIVNAAREALADLNRKDALNAVPQPVSSNTSNKKTGGCYIATAVYGSYNCPEVWILRRFRDDVLAKSWPGRAFIQLYYAVSPAVVRRMGNRRGFNRFWKCVLNRLITGLKLHGFKDTPYKDPD